MPKSAAVSLISARREDLREIYDDLTTMQGRLSCAVHVLDSEVLNASRGQVKNPELAANAVILVSDLDDELRALSIRLDRAIAAQGVANG